MTDLAVQEMVMDSPAERLGAALRQHRVKRGLTLEEIAKRLDYAYTPTVLQMIESARYPLESDQVADVLYSYDADPGLSVLADELSEPDGDPGGSGPEQTVRELNQSTTAEGLLYEYLDFVYEIRGVDPGSLIPLREADLAVLSKTIGWSVRAIQDHLTNLMALWRQTEPVDAGRRSHARVAVLLSAATRRHAAEWASQSTEGESDDAGDEPKKAATPMKGAKACLTAKKAPAKTSRGKNSKSGKEKHSGKKNSTKKNPTKKNSTKKNSTKKNSTKKNSTKKNSTKKNSTKKGTGKKKAAKA